MFIDKYVNSNHSKMKTHFPVLFCMAQLMGLPISLQYSHYQMSNKQIGFFYWILNCLRILSLIFSCLSVYHLLKATTLRVTFVSYNTCGTITMLVIILKRKRIRKAVHTLMELSVELNPDCYIG
ncbi:unnamed protein product, partial [Larinioides sclopetarius]